MNNYCEMYNQELQKRKNLQSKNISTLNNSQSINNQNCANNVDKQIYSNKDTDNEYTNNLLNQEIINVEDDLKYNKQQDCDLENINKTNQGSENMFFKKKNSNVNVDNSAQNVDNLKFDTTCLNSQSNNQINNQFDNNINNKVNSQFNNKQINQFNIIDNNQTVQTLKDDGYNAPQTPLVTPIETTPQQNNSEIIVDNPNNNLLYGLRDTYCDYRTVKILKNLMSSIVSELTAINTYTYQHQIARLSNIELSTALNKIAKDEMEHLQMLSYAIVQFGGRPKYTNANNVFWNARYVDYSIVTSDFLQTDIKNEQIAIANYEKAIQKVTNQSLKNMFTNIIADERRHIEILSKFL